MLLRISLACCLASAALARPPQFTQLAPRRPASLCFVPPTGALLWSDPATWPGGVPGPGDCARVQVGMTVYLDTSTAALGGLEVGGQLIVLCGDYTITSDWIQVTGLLEVGGYGPSVYWP